MLVTTGNEVANARITAYLGVVRGIVVRSMSFTDALSGSLRAMRGGNIREFVAVCETARKEAYDLMVAHAAELGADAIIAMRYDAVEFAQGSSEVLAYGTAVKVKFEESAEAQGLST